MGKGSAAGSSERTSRAGAGIDPESGRTGDPREPGWGERGAMNTRVEIPAPPSLDPQPLIRFEDAGMLSRHHPVISVRAEGAAQRRPVRLVDGGKMPVTADPRAGGADEHIGVFRKPGLAPTAQVAAKPDRGSGDGDPFRHKEPRVPVLPLRAVHAPDDIVGLKSA